MKLLSDSDYKDLKATDNRALISFVNPYSYYEIKDNERLSREFHGFFSDGSLLCLLNNFFNENKIERISFDYSSIANDFLSYCEESDLTVSILGAKQDELSKTIVIFKDKYPKLKLGYCRNGYFSNDEFEGIMLSLKSSDVVIVGMGAPTQEEIAARIFKENNHRLVITCGGFITQTSIKEDYYHPIIKKLGLRWLQRIVMHKHVRDKVLSKYPSFIVRYIKENVSSNRFFNLL
ncbi:WecB/TagA/CpsF family glycosyltransferase [Vibrio gallicus]|uniref:WecB/TagA/CpsF family glycosyltransferase n=1 Tax=Vibrio gallicus TaxID=190897 RepID=UPI0021C3258D|nr:WecB/TagA/CpsF family glycosyltransferase [Vibrio gallicus]